MVEQRRAARSSINVPLEFIPKGSAERLSGMGKDISVGGMFIGTATPAAFGSAISVRIRLDGQKDELTFPGTVRWTSAEGMGVQFGLLGVRETHAITEILKAGAKEQPV